MHNNGVETKRKYKVEDLSGFFKERSKDVSKVFSNEAVEISTIRSRSVTSDMQELSFKFKLLTGADEDIPSTILPQIKHLIDFFKICLFQGKNFKVDIKVPEESGELYNNCYGTDNCETVEEFISNAPHQLLLQGITIALQTDVKNINLDNLHEIESFLNGKLKCAQKNGGKEDTLQIEETENKGEQGQSKTEQTVVSKDSFGYSIASHRKQITRAPVVIAAMRENVSWFRSFLYMPNFLNTIQFLFQQPPELSTQKQKVLTYCLTPQETKRNEVVQKDEISERETDETAKLSDIGQTRSHTDYFKANRKKSKKQTEELSEEEKQSIIKQAQINTRLAMIDNLTERRGKKLDEIFVEVISGYKNQDPETFSNIFDSVFNIVYFRDKQLHEILDSGKISEVLEILEIPHPSGKSSFPKEYLQKQVCRKKEQLLKLVSGIPIQPFPQPKNISYENGNYVPNEASNPSLEINKASPTADTTFKSSLKTVFSSKETYFCLFLIASSISMLCLWHLPLGKESILKGLVPSEKVESIGLVLNIGLPTLIALCILSLAYFIYSECSVESVEQVSENEYLSRT
ncbi:MAG: hypothetical protein ACR5K9_02180 [Wolbachia sp.]